MKISCNEWGNTFSSKGNDSEKSLAEFDKSNSISRFWFFNVKG